MQAKLGGPRSGLTTGEVDEVLLHAAGGRVRWGVDYEVSGTARGPVVLDERSQADWEAGTMGVLLTGAGGFLTRVES